MEKSLNHPYYDPSDTEVKKPTASSENQDFGSLNEQQIRQLATLELPLNPLQENYKPMDVEFILQTSTSHLISKENLHRISIAPMFDVTNTHFRFFMRLITRCATLWTEMIHFTALEEDDQKRDLNLRFHACEQPVVCQLGGSDASALQRSSKFVRKYGYSEVNLNSGCPSSKVQKGCFGAILMKQENRSQLVDIVDSM